MEIIISNQPVSIELADDQYSVLLSDLGYTTQTTVNRTITRKRSAIEITGVRPASKNSVRGYNAIVNVDLGRICDLKTEDGRNAHAFGRLWVGPENPAYAVISAYAEATINSEFDSRGQLIYRAGEAVNYPLHLSLAGDFGYLRFFVVEGESTANGRVFNAVDFDQKGASWYSPVETRALAPTEGERSPFLVSGAGVQRIAAEAPKPQPKATSSIALPAALK